MSNPIKMIKKFIALFVIFYSFTASADTLPLIDSLIQCTPDFFKVVYTNKEDLEKHTSIKIFEKNQAYISIENRSNADKNYVYFKTPITYKDLTITGYYDSSMDLGKIGKYYFWGFIIDNDINQIKETLNGVDWKNMEDNLLYIGNPMIRSINDDIQVWHKNTGTVVGVKTIPAPDTTEKLLLLEKGPNMNLLVCSIQGIVTPTLLKQERPDIQ
ncbi:hypothetical protein GQ597_06865 [Gilliamella sp. Pra-s65]|uniref:hypothetical protein n=1 Tax=unclassified Gilliamella TaxID=2685620 RepID=UPI00136562BD|nr:MULTISPECIES: hypothetical protein [unclassified Gilliamella]MWN90417.1 hypothetical protein [Gilliamella sp. Pra-s65]MWP47723.1 hypothetical protein [Gilliamella sp. Pas-s27]MWP73484.1 hypothetical protein [Gilliamella sp. Pra-s52]